MTDAKLRALRCIDAYLAAPRDSDAAEVHYVAALEWLSGSYEDEYPGRIATMNIKVIKGTLDALIELRRDRR